MLDVFTWGLSIVLMVVGLVGVIVPLLPGTTLILAAAVLHKFLLPGDLSWWVVSVIAGVWVISIVADFAGVVVGTRLFGGSKWGMAGASGGALVGIFFSLPAMILGTVLGAFVAEKVLAKKEQGAALKAGAGAAAGFVISTVARFLCAGVMIALFLAAALTHRGVPAS